MNKVMEIRTPEDFVRYLELCGPNKDPIDAKLMNDIDISNVRYNNDYVFLQGTFDGQGYTIKGVKQLFSSIEKTGGVENLTVKGKYYCTTQSSFCYDNWGTIENCISQVDIYHGTGFCDVLGDSGKLINCRNEGKIKHDPCYPDFKSLNFDVDKLQFVKNIVKGAIYKNNIAAGSFDTASGYAVPVEMLIKSISLEKFLSDSQIKEVLGLNFPHIDKKGRTWLQQFINGVKYINTKQSRRENVVKIIVNMALYTDIDFNAKDEYGKTAIDPLYKRDGKMIPETSFIKKLITKISAEQRKNKISDTQEINDWGIER